jgi:hypothetical protein
MTFYDKLVDVNDELNYFENAEISKLKRGIGEYFFQKFSEAIDAKNERDENFYGYLLTKIVTFHEANANGASLTLNKEDLLKKYSTQEDRIAKINLFKTPFNQISQE